MPLHIIKAAADTEGELKSCLTVMSYRPALCMTAKVVKPDLQISKKAPERADRCEPIEINYAVTNDGTGDVGTFQIIDELGDGLKTIEGESTLRFAVNGLKEGETRTFLARVFATRAGSFSSRAVAVAEESDLRARSARTTTEVIAADLDVQVDGQGRVYGSSLARFNAQVTNIGNTPAENVVVNIRWPNDARLMDISDYQVRRGANRNQQSARQSRSASVQESDRDTNAQQQGANQQASSQQSGQQSMPNQRSMNQEQMVIERLEPGQTATFQYAVRPLDNEEIVTQVEAAYVCAVDVAEGEQARAEATATAMARATFVRLPAMQLFVVDDEDPVMNGTQVTYTIRVINEGDAPDQNVQITAELPEGLQFDSARGPTEHQVEGSSISFQPIEELAAGDSVDFQIVAENQGEGSVRFKANLTSEQLDSKVTAEEPTQLASSN